MRCAALCCLLACPRRIRELDLRVPAQGRSFEHPTAIPADKAQRYRFDLPNVNHVFQSGHRIMVQIQSTLFPIYDRNPQTFVPNILVSSPAPSGCRSSTRADSGRRNLART